MIEIFRQIDLKPTIYTTSLNGLEILKTTYVRTMYMYVAVYVGIYLRRDMF